MNSITDILRIAMQALGARSLVFLALAMAFGLFAWAMYLNGVMALAVAVAFSVLVFLPVLLKGSRNHEQETE